MIMRDWDWNLFRQKVPLQLLTEIPTGLGYKPTSYRVGLERTRELEDQRELERLERTREDDFTK